MVIGSGLVARRFKLYNNEDNFLVFASGVSNSKTKNPEAYSREIKLLKNCVQKYNTKTLIYFGTCSIYDPQEKESTYVQHKLLIEDFIQTSVKKYHYSGFRTWREYPPIQIHCLISFLAM